MIVLVYIMNQTVEQKNDGYGKRPLWQWVVIYLVIGGIIYAGIYYFFLAKKRGGFNYNQPGQSRTQSTTNPQVSPTTTQVSETTQSTRVIITYSSSGFSPSTVTAKSYGKITWVNKSDRQVKIGANPHPIHTGNKEVSGGEFTLDLQPGEEKTVVVSKVGTFGYHNHLNSSEEGTIVVE